MQKKDFFHKIESLKNVIMDIKIQSYIKKTSKNLNIARIKEILDHIIVEHSQAVINEYKEELHRLSEDIKLLSSEKRIYMVFGQLSKQFASLRQSEVIEQEKQNIREKIDEIGIDLKIEPMPFIKLYNSTQSLMKALNPTLIKHNIKALSKCVSALKELESTFECSIMMNDLKNRIQEIVNERIVEDIPNLSFDFAVLWEPCKSSKIVKGTDRVSKPSLQINASSKSSYQAPHHAISSLRQDIENLKKSITTRNDGIKIKDIIETIETNRVLKQKAAGIM